MKKTKRFLKKKHKQVKKKTKFLLRHPLVLPVTIFFVLVFFGLGMFVTVGATTVGAKDKKIVDLYVDDEQQTLSTRAKTVADLLERLDIRLLDEDIVEPNLDTLLFEDNTQVNVYRARPVSIVDGERTITVLSAHQSPRLIAQDAKIDLNPEDVVEAVPVDELPSALVEPAERLTIERAVEVQLNVYGVVSTKRTTTKTVGEFLEAEGVTVSEDATLQPENIDTPISKGLLIGVNKVGVKTVSEVEPIPFATESRDDASLQVGQSRVDVQGENGEQTVVYEITEQDGVEVERRAIQTVVTKNPVTHVVVRGSKPATLSSSVSVSADKAALMAAAGIVASDFPYVDFIISHESGWRPGAVNSSSGAYGLCQSLPASKMASAGADYLTNPVTQLRWCSGYASGRYGGWAGAYNAWLAQKWW
jgi:uncharacterized protein YabE (DUF348 family)